MITRILQSISHHPRAWLEVQAGGRATVFVLHRGLSKPEYSGFGRDVRGQPAPVLAQQPADLAGMDLAIWETQRCAVPLLGFSMPGEGGQAQSTTTWLTAGPAEPVFAAGLRSVTEQPGPGGSGFSLLAARSAHAPLWRPLYISGISVDEWLRLPGSEAMSWLRSDWTQPRSVQPASPYRPVLAGNDAVEVSA